MQFKDEVANNGMSRRVHNAGQIEEEKKGQETVKDNKQGDKD